MFKIIISRKRREKKERKFKICERAYEILTTKLNFPPQDIIFDPNIFAVATGIEEHNNYALDFFEATKLIKKKLPLIDKEILEKPKNKSFINPYIFSKILFQMFKKNEVVVCSNASVSVIPMQSVDFKKPLRIISNAGSASMGYELPAAIGAKFANKSNRVICLAGDGSIMQNIQELDLIKRYNLNIKIVIFNNEGYLSIKITQRNFFKKLDGSNNKSGISFPSFKKVANTFNLKYLKIQNEKQIYKLKKFLNSNGPGIIEVMIDPEQIYQPKLGSFKNDKGKIVSDSLDNMSPHLDQKLINELRNL